MSSLPSATLLYRLGMRVIAVIPARGGSKGLKDKNLQTVANVSLIGRAIRSVRQVSNVHDVIVSTDSKKISVESKKWGAKVVLRPDSLSGDEASSESAIQHVLDELGPLYDVVLFVQCTSPFIDPKDMDDAIDLIQTGKYDSVFSGVEDHGFRWEFVGESLFPVGHPMSKRPRRQELPRRILETGAFYAFTTEGFYVTGSRFHGRVGTILQDRFSQIDIDSQADLDWARQISLILPKSDQRTAIRALILDFDGVQTDDYVWVDQDGKESVRVSRSDGLAISMLQKAGIQVLILSSEANRVVRVRADKLGVELIQGLDNKEAALSKWADEKKIDLNAIAYLGNDLNDLSAMMLVGFPVAVADATPLIRSTASHILMSKGGEKAVRELASILLDIGKGE